MDFNFDTGTIYQGLATLDVTALPPLGTGPANVLTILGNGALTLPKGTAGERPAASGGTDVAGMFRYNTGVNQLEYFDSTSWQQLTSSAGSVSSFQTSLSGLTPQTATTGAITLAGTLGATSGGTGASTGPTAGQFLYSSAGTTYTPTTLSGVAVTTFSGDTTGLTPATPTSGAITLGGTLVLANGGTNASLTAVAGAPVYSTASAFAIGTAGTAGDAYISGGAGAPSWQSVSSTLTTDQILEADGSGAFTANGATFVGSGSYSGVTLSGTVTNSTDATTKEYVDSVAAGLSWKQAVVVATTVADGNINLTTGGLLTLDTNYTVSAGERVLVKNQTNAAQNGIYIASASTWVRSTDMDSITPINEINGAAVFIENGLSQADTAWVQTANVTTLGTDPLVWSQFSGQGTYLAGNGLTLSGNTFSLTSPVSIANGGTALSTAPSNGQLLIGNGTGYTLATLTDGTAISITEGAGTITIDNTGVTSVAAGSGISVSASTGSVTIGNTGVLSFSGGTTGLTPNTATTGAVTLAGTLVVGNGGTGVTSLTTNGVLYGGSTVGATAEGATGQVLVGTTGSAPSWTALSGVAVTSFQTSLSGLTPATATSGAVTLAGTLGYTSGGTGLSTLGTANQILGVNAGATGMEYKTVTAGTGISVTHGTNVVTITNDGVTSFSLADTSTTPIYTVTPTTASTGAVAATIDLNSQNANLVFAGPVTGGAAEPTFRTLVYADIVGTGAALQLYAENPVTPTAPSATGANAISLGSSSTASAEDGIAFGDGTDARIIGMKAFANGQFSTTPGSAQSGLYVLRNTTTDNTANVELFLNGTSEQIVMPDNSVFTFDILVAARRTDAVGGGAAYRFVGAARKDATAGSVTFIGTPSKTVIGETNNAWDAAVSVDTTTGAFRVRVTGENAKTIRWVATVTTTEVTN